MNVVEHYPRAMKFLRGTIKSSGYSSKYIAELLKHNDFSFEAAHYLVTGHPPRKWTT